MTISQHVNEALLAISAIVSLFLIPILTNWLTAKNADGAIKQAIAGGLSLVVAVLAVLLAGEFDLTNLSATVFVVLGAAKVGYEVFSKLIAPVSNTGPQIGKTNDSTSNS